MSYSILRSLNYLEEWIDKEPSVVHKEEFQFCEFEPILDKIIYDSSEIIRSFVSEASGDPTAKEYAKIIKEKIHQFRQGEQKSG